MAVILLDVVDEDVDVRHDRHVERNEEFEAGELGGSVEHLGDAVGHPVVRPNVECKSINSCSLSEADCVGEVADVRRVGVSHHVVGEDALCARLLGEHAAQSNDC